MSQCVSDGPFFLGNGLLLSGHLCKTRMPLKTFPLTNVLLRTKLLTHRCTNELGQHLFGVLACCLAGAKPLPDIFPFWSTGNHFCKVCIKIQKFLLKKSYLKISSAKWWPFYSDLKALSNCIIRSGVTLDLRTYVHPGRACRFTYAVRWSGIPRKSRSGLTYFHFPALVWQGNAIRSSRWIE